MSAFTEHLYSGQTVIVAGTIGGDHIHLLSRIGFDRLLNAHLALVIDLERRQVDVIKDREPSGVSEFMAALVEQFPSAVRRSADHQSILEPDDEDLVLLRLFARN